MLLKQNWKANEEEKIDSALSDALRMNVIDLQRERRRRLDEKIKLAVRSVVTDLPEVERLVIYLYFWKGLEVTEISNATRMSESMIYQVRETALNRLKARFRTLGIDKEYFKYLQEDAVK